MRRKVTNAGETADGERPARRLRWLAWMLGLVPLLGAGAVSIPLLAPPPPQVEVERARAAVRAARLDARQLAPQETARALALGAALERRLAKASGPFADRDDEGLLTLALDTELAARGALLAARRVRLRSAGGLSRDLVELEDRLAETESELDVFPIDPGLRRSVLRGRVQLAAAVAAATAGEVVRARAALAAAEDELARFDRLLLGRYARLRDPQLHRLWQTWADEAVAASRDGRVAIIVDKLRGRCYLIQGGRVRASFRAELGRNGLADKLYAGDAATPEGRYRVVQKRQGSRTRFHRALLLDYPNAEDRRRYLEARRQGRIPVGRGIGGLIEIHGEGGKGHNWTDGCVALDNRDMDRLFTAVEAGTPVAIVGQAQLPAPPGPADHDKPTRER